MLSILSGNTLELAENILAGAALGNTLSSAGQDNIEVHAKDTGVGVVLNSKINMLVNAKSEIA